ncbi:MAG: Uma2 family endonuclease [Quinella sp. 3Q1]|nr:Uma2 family endonuclease [Quinella sp. 3Q1]MBR3050682.1 Uma2 family endonuclease [Selenomonadaceae bacterium]MBR6888732.1 Uma2 family endonuclease [Selenomonadaceae bacterium]
MSTEIINERLLYPSYEIIGGKKIMAPAANPTHGSIIGRLYAFFFSYLDAKNAGYVFVDDVDVYLKEGPLFKPDLIVVLEENSSIIDWDKGIYGSPDMLVEVLSKSTKKRDVTIKKDTYEANGVREYWIVDPYMKAISVYLLRDGKYFLDDEYILFDDKELELLTEEEKADVKHEVPVSILDGLKVPLKYIFKWGYR